MPRDKEMCEICGRREARFTVMIEGAVMNACAVCAKGAKILHKKPEEKAERGVRIVETGMVDEDIVDGYGQLIKKTREEKGMSRHELAKRLNEMESYLEHIEKEEMRPTLKTARKIEKALGIKLIEKTTEVIVEKTEKKKNDEPTLEDFVEEKKK